MKIPKLFKKAAAFVMAAVTALSIMPATAFAAGDIGTIFFSHTYDSNGNAMRYNSSANIGGYTAGGTGNYKYRMFVDGENAFCIQPGVPLKTGNTLKKASSDTWNALSAKRYYIYAVWILHGIFLFIPCSWKRKIRVYSWSLPTRYLLHSRYLNFSIYMGIKRYFICTADCRCSLCTYYSIYGNPFA